jgi:uncharacterized protein
MIGEISRLAMAFAPNTQLAESLLAHTADADGSHDVAHILRVWNNACMISAEEGGDPTILSAGVILHDCVAIEKDSPLRSQASRLAAQKARTVLGELGWRRREIDEAAHAIEAHSFSAGVTPVSLEAKILQDADRLDAIGAIGVARCFHVGGRLGRALYAPLDPEGRERALDDARYTLDHFQTKLFRIADGFQTATGTRLAQSRQRRIRRFFDEFVEEISAGAAGETSTPPH